MDRSQKAAIIEEMKAKANDASIAVELCIRDRILLLGRHGSPAGLLVQPLGDEPLRRQPLHRGAPGKPVGPLSLAQAG